MKIKRLKIFFIVLFFAMIVIPLLNSDLYGGKLSISEKRYLAQRPKLITADNNINIFFPDEFESWINDNIGFRDQMVKFNAKVQYYLFDVLSNNSDMVLGPNGEFNYVADDIIPSYQHFDLKTDEELEDIATAFQTINDYLKNKNIQLYYFQCWDKQSVYPEYFPDTIIQHGEISKTEQIVDTICSNTDVCVVSPKNLLIEAKKDYETYSRWGDPAHWTQRGAVIGYRALLNAINKNNDEKYPVLNEDDYIISLTDQGSTLFGGIHKEDYLENFEIINPKAYITGEEPKWLSSWANDTKYIYYNDSVDNDDTLLVLGDSYFDNFIYDDLAESFHRVIHIWGDFATDFDEIIDEYKPQIVVIENAERCDRTELYANMSRRLAE